LKKRIRQSNAKSGEKWRVLVSLLIIFTTATLQAQQPAFSTAEGSGRFATGGRGGEVYEVTNLSNSGPGSIVDAVSSANRTIVFRLSGTIELGNTLLRPKSNTTIAGQTAPGDGICIKGRIYLGAVSNVVIRYIRIRVDAGAANSSGDAIDIDEGTNIIIDHVSASYARDEGISCQEPSNQVTVQWCIISEALTFENHSYGSLVRGDYGDVKSYHHNLYAHNNNRLPRPGNYTATSIDSVGLYFDFRNGELLQKFYAASLQGRGINCQFDRQSLMTKTSNLPKSS
jgi:pectate lyase